MAYLAELFPVAVHAVPFLVHGLERSARDHSGALFAGEAVFMVGPLVVHDSPVVRNGQIASTAAHAEVADEAGLAEDTALVGLKTARSDTLVAVLTLEARYVVYFFLYRTKESY